MSLPKLVHKSLSNYLKVFYFTNFNTLFIRIYALKILEFLLLAIGGDNSYVRSLLRLRFIVRRRKGSC